MEDKPFAIGKIASNCITTAKIAEGCLSGSGVFRIVVDKTKNKNQNMQVTDKDTLIITIDGKTKLITREEITNAFRDKTQYQKNMEAVQKDWDERLRQNNCANYERDNNLSEMEENVRDAMDNQVNKKYKKNVEEQILGSISVNHCKDVIVEQVRQKLLDRSAVGIKKYNTTLESNNKDNYLNHLQQELMDGSLYIQKIMQQEKDITELVASEGNDWELGKKIRYIYGK